MLMDYFNNILTTFLGLEHMVVPLPSIQGQKALGFHQKKIFICVPKMNEGLTGLEWHKG